MSDAIRLAPGQPGIEPRWTSSAKSGVGTALGDGSRVWFTLSHGILNEIYYPEVDTACTRDAGFLVAGPGGFVSEEKRDCAHVAEWLAPGAPAFRLLNSCNEGRYTIEKRVCAAPEYDVVLQRVRFTPLVGTLDDYTLVFLLSPHLGNHGAGNTGWFGTHKGERLLFARRESLSLAVACSTPWRQCTAGFAGPDDAWNDVHRNGRLRSIYDRAEDGNIALAAELAASASRGEFTISIGFGGDPDSAALHARAALAEPYEAIEQRYLAAWHGWQAPLQPLDEPAAASEPHLYRASTSVMKTHMSMHCDGGVIASLSVPWGATKGDGDLGGYHLVWPRDAVETAGGLLAAGGHAEMKTVLRFLEVTQEADGHWPQNMWLNGVPYWNGIQLDEAAFPILLVDLGRREGALDAAAVEHCWPMVCRAATYVAMRGAASDQDRWEEDAGYSPFTLGVEVAGLLAAAELAELAGMQPLAGYFRDTADDWNASIERWTYVADTALARQVGVRGYYVRIGNADEADASASRAALVPVKNGRDATREVATSDLVSADALALVRFGVRDAADPRIVDTVRVIDALLKVDTQTGPTWRRYNGDGYGEHEDGSAFDGAGIGRGWPLLTGERAHYELAAGNRAQAERLAGVMRSQAGLGGMLPEQVWDAPDIPELELFNGRPAGSAMPLVWAHSEYVKLLRSLREGRVFDRPPQTYERYVAAQNHPRVASWRFTVKRREIPAGRVLRLDVEVATRVRWTSDGWVTWADTSSRRMAHGVHVAEIAVQGLAAGSTISFTFYWVDAARWEGENFDVTILPV